MRETMKHPKRNILRKRKLLWRRPNRKSQKKNKQITHQLHPERRKLRLSLRSPSLNLTQRPIKKRMQLL